MADFEREPIILHYDGLDASGKKLELGQLGISLQGASKLIGVAAHYAVTGKYAKKSPALSVRILAGAPQANCLEIPAYIYALKPAVDPILPFIKTAGIKTVEAMIGYVIAKVAGKKKAEDAAMEVLKEALKEQGQTSRTAIEAMRDVAIAMAAANIPAVKSFSAPVGETCETARIGQTKNGAVSIDQATKQAICQKSEPKIQSERDWKIFISELDLQSSTCKISLDGDDDPDRRYTGVIIDPVIYTTNSVYGIAMNAHQWLRVRGKAELIDGEMSRIFISDAEPA